MAPDPKPRRRGHRPRRGVEPSGLRRWRLSHRSKADPRPRRRRRRSYDPTKSKPAYTGSRGGRYWQGPTKRRYDPQPRRHFTRAKAYGSKLEGGLAKYGALIGAGIAALIGVKAGMDTYTTAYGAEAANKYMARITGSDGRPAEISHLWSMEDYAGGVPGSFTPLTYLRYKILGQDLAGNQTPSAWVLPFWGGIAALIAGFILKRVPNSKAHRIGRVLQPIGMGATAVATIGACALPGCPDPKTGIDPMMGSKTPRLALPSTVLPYQYVGQNEGAY